MFANRLLVSAQHAQCESDESKKPSYHPFIEPKLKPFINPSTIKSHYNFIHDSLPYRTSNANQLKLYDQYMNDVLSFNNIDKWKRIIKCLHNDQHDTSKQLLCKSLCTDYHIANEDILSAQSTIKSAYNTFKKHNINDLCMYDREELYVLAFYEWIIHFDEKSAQKIFRFISTEYPFDLYAAKRAQEMAFNLSDWDSMLSIFLDIKPYHHVNGNKNPLKLNGYNVPSAYYNGMLSFSYEQMGYLQIAEQIALEGLQYYIDDNWLQHSLIHSRYFQRNTAQDLQKLIEYIIENGSEYWDIIEKHAFITTHNWWHIALLYLELDGIEEAVEILKQHIWRQNLDRRADQIGALSMFWILTMVIDCKFKQLENEKYDKLRADIGCLWEVAMDYVYETYKNVEVGYKLYDILFMRGVIEMKARYKYKNNYEDQVKYNKFKKCYVELMEEMIAFCGDDQQMMDKYIGVVSAMDLIYGEDVDDKSRKKAYEILSTIVDDLNIIGGSREQRFVFDQMYIDLLMMNKQRKVLKRFLESFLAKYPIKSLQILAAECT